MNARTLAATLVLSLGLLAPLHAAEAGVAATPRAKQGEKRTLGAKRTDRSERKARARDRRRARPKPAANVTPQATETTASPAPQPTAPSQPTPEPNAPESTAPVPAPAPAQTPAPAASSDVLFRSDFESAFAGWYVQSLPSRATLPAGGAFDGSKAARFEVRDGDVEPDTGSERSEVSGPTFDEGQDLYIRDAIRVPGSNTYSAPWQIVQQLHETGWGGSPGIAVFLDDKRTLKLAAGDGSPTYWQGPSLQPDRWYDLVYRVFLSQNPSEGFVEVWLDGTQQTLRNGSTRMYGQTIQTEHTYIKAGIYRSKSSTGTSVVEHDGIVVGTSPAAVTAD